MLDSKGDLVSSEQYDRIWATQLVGLSVLREGCWYSRLSRVLHEEEEEDRKEEDAKSGFRKARKQRAMDASLLRVRV